MKEEGEEGTEEEVATLQEVAGPDLVAVVANEGRPGLPRRSGLPDPPQVLLDRALGDADAELEQLTADPLGSPEPVVARHALDQRDRLPGSPRATAPPL